MTEVSHSLATTLRTEKLSMKIHKLTTEAKKIEKLKPVSPLTPMNIKKNTKDKVTSTILEVNQMTMIVMITERTTQVSTIGQNIKSYRLDHISLPFRKMTVLKILNAQVIP